MRGALPRTWREMSSRKSLSPGNSSCARILLQQAEREWNAKRVIHSMKIHSHHLVWPAPDIGIRRPPEITNHSGWRSASPVAVQPPSIERLEPVI